MFKRAVAKDKTSNIDISLDFMDIININNNMDHLQVLLSFSKEILNAVKVHKCIHNFSRSGKNINNKVNKI